MHTGHAHLSYKPPSFAASAPIPAPPPLEPLSPLSDLSPSPPLLNRNVQGPPRTRLASGSTARPSHRRRDAAENSLPPLVSTPATSVRRIRPLACVASNANAQSVGKEKPMKNDAWKVGGVQQERQQMQPQQIIEFPPKHVVLHPDDVNNKVFLAMGRALMSMDNRAMTIKDLAELTMQHGLVCQNVSAASQAITFFIRSHLSRCEEQDDFPLLLRHVLSGTTRDDALAPALYSRTGGNVSTKDRMTRDENGVITERVTCFRRGTTVWYLSKAVGAPCPFARAGIALRDYAEGSAITSVEGRKGDSDLLRGIKRKRQRNLRRRAGSGPAARRPDDDSDSDEGTKPPKIKLTLRLRPCVTNLSGKKAELDSDEGSSSSSSDSESDAQDESMDIDTSARLSNPPQTESSSESTWTFPPYPIKRRIEIPPYTPSEYIYPTFYTSPTTNYPTPTFFSEWPACMKPRLPLACVDDSAARSSSCSQRDRAGSVPFSVASPPPESDEEFGFDDDDDDDEGISISMSPELKFKREDELAYVWPQAAPSNSSFDLVHIKSEPSNDDVNEAGSSKRLSTQTVKQENRDELDLDMTSLSLTFGEGSIVGHELYGLGVKEGDYDLFGLGHGFSWGQPVDLTQDGPVQSACETEGQQQVVDDVALQRLWRNVELLGPETVQLQELEDGSWEEYVPSQEKDCNSPSTEQTNEGQDEEDERCLPPTPSRSRASTLDSLSPPPSLASSVHTWSVCSPDTEIDSVGPTSPPSFAGPEPPAVVRDDESIHVVREDDYEIKRSRVWSIPGRPATSSVPSRQSAAARSDDVLGIPLSEDSAPWERGMCTEEDVEKHLLEPPRPLAMMSIKLPSYLDAVPALEPPLSPQEEAVFQSLCIDMPWQDETQTSETKPDAEDTPELQRPHTPDTTLTNVFAAATRPTMRLRERRPSKRPAERERARKQAEICRSEAAQDAVDSDMADPTMGAMTRRREKVDPAANSNDTDSGIKAPLRRSRRVANATAMQRNRERLRKRTVS